MRKFVSDRGCRKLLHRSLQNLKQQLQHQNQQQQRPLSLSQSRFLSSTSFSMAPIPSSSDPFVSPVTLDTINPKVMPLLFKPYFLYVFFNWVLFMMWIRQLGSLFSLIYVFLHLGLSWSYLFFVFLLLGLLDLDG